MTAVAPVAANVKTFPVVELFGPTLQGEGPDAGRRAFFVRLGGCDYRCSWCDSMHAVEPALVRQARRRSATGIVRELAELGALAKDLIVLSGGNPALHRLDPLMAELRWVGLRVSVETQGSFWRPWLNNVDRLVVSPKPPSSGMATERNERAFERFMARVRPIARRVAVKIVVFDSIDYEWARTLIYELAYRPGWVGLSCGTDSQGKEPLSELAARYRWLAERLAHDVGGPMVGVSALPQLHVIAWSHEVGR